MALFDRWRSKPGPHVSEQAFQENLARQLEMSPQTLAQLRNLGVDEHRSLRLEVFFYTNTREKAEALTAVLADKGYEIKSGPAAHDRKVQVITGWSTPVEMSESGLLSWTEEMCRIGYRHDCEFDGWGTTPEQ